MSEHIHQKHPGHQAKARAHSGSRISATTEENAGGSAAAIGLAGTGGAGIGGGSAAAVMQCLGHYAEPTESSAQEVKARSCSVRSAGMMSPELICQKGDVKDDKGGHAGVTREEIEKEIEKREKANPGYRELRKIAPFDILNTDSSRGLTG